MRTIRVEPENWLNFNQLLHVKCARAGLLSPPMTAVSKITGAMAKFSGFSVRHYIAEGWMEKVGLPSDLERDMLDCVVEPGPTSRLGCQVSVTEQLDGLVVRVPEAQY